MVQLDQQEQMDPMGILDLLVQHLVYRDQQVPQELLVLRAQQALLVLQDQQEQMV